MRVTSVRAVQPRTPGDPPDWRTALGQILVVVDTDGGVRGYGVGGGGAAGIHVIESVLAPLVLGEDPRDAEALWERMYRATHAYGRQGLVIMALSGLDNALWDAWGKAEGSSVARLLGGPRETHIPCYATTPRPAEAVALGFRAVKLHFQRPCAEGEAVARVAATRAAVGPEVALFTDLHGHWDLDANLRLAEAFAAHVVGWMEEPLATDDLAAYADLTRRSPVPIAGGEHEYTIHAFRTLAERGVFSVWQPDATWTGGMTQMKAIYALAAGGTGGGAPDRGAGAAAPGGRDAGDPAAKAGWGPPILDNVRVCPHRGAEVWGLHAIAALDPAPLAESPRPWITWLRGQPPIVDGFIDLADRPGFGVDVAPDLLGF